MARYLIDANVLSEATKPDPQPAVIDWMRRNEPEVTVDPIVLGEVRYGILLVAPGRRRSRLERWFDEGVRRMECVAWDASTGARWAELLATLRADGRAMPVKDSMIAASALAHDLAIATLNRRDFQAAGVELVDPSAADPGA